MTINSKALIGFIVVVLLFIAVNLFSIFSNYFLPVDPVSELDHSSIAGLSMLLYIAVLICLKQYLNNLLEVRNVNWAIYGLVILTIYRMIVFFSNLDFMTGYEFYRIQSMSSGTLSLVFSLGLAINILRIENEEYQKQLKFYAYAVIANSAIWFLYPFLGFFYWGNISIILSLINLLPPIALIVLYNKTYKSVKEQEFL